MKQNPITRDFQRFIYFCEKPQWASPTNAEREVQVRAGVPPPFFRGDHREDGSGRVRTRQIWCA